MEQNTAYLLHQINQMRDPQLANISQNQIIEFLRSPTSIANLFQIISEIKDDFIIKFALLCITRYCEFNKQNLSQENIDQIKSNLLILLTTTQNPEFLPLIINSISTVFYSLHQHNWNELFVFAFSANEDSNLFVVSSILEIITPMLPMEIINEKIHYFDEILSRGLLSSHFEYKLECLSFGAKIVEKSENVYLLKRVKDLVQQNVQEILEMVQKTGDFTLFHRFFNAILEYADQDLYFILDNEIFQDFFKIIYNSSVPFELRIPLHTYIAKICEHPKLFDCFQAITFVQQVFIKESVFIREVFDFYMEEEMRNFLWTETFSIIILEIIPIIPPDKIIQVFNTNFINFGIMEQDRCRFLALFYLYCAVIYDFSLFEDMVIHYFPTIMGFLNDPSIVIRRYTSEILTVLLPMYPEIIIENFHALVQQIMNFTVQNQGQFGSDILEALFSSKFINSDIVDEIFEPTYQFCMSGLMSNIHSLSYDCYSILRLLISISKHVATIAPELYQFCKNKISEDPGNSEFMIIIAQLFTNAANTIVGNFVEFLTFLNQGLNSNDYNVIKDVTESLDIFLKVLCKNRENPEFKNIINQLDIILKNASQQNYDPEIADFYSVNMRISCLQQYIRFTYLVQLNEERLSYIISCFSIALQTFNNLNNHEPLLTSICEFFELIITLNDGNDFFSNNSDLQNMGHQILLLFIHDERSSMTELTYIFQTIYQLVELFGIERLQIESDKIFNFIFENSEFHNSINRNDHINENQINIIQCDMNQLNSMTAGKAILAIIMKESNEEKKSRILSNFLQSLISQISSGNQFKFISSLNIFSTIITDSSIHLFNQENFGQFICPVLEIMNESKPNVIMHIISFVIAFTKSPFMRLLFLPYVNQCLQILISKFNMPEFTSNLYPAVRELMIVCIGQLYQYENVEFPTPDILRIILPFLPLKIQMKHSKTVYLFINNHQQVANENPDIYVAIVKLYIQILSNQNNEIEYMNDVTLLTLISSFVHHFLHTKESDEEQNAFIAETLNFNGNAIQEFFVNYNLEIPNDMQCPEIIDLTLLQ